MLDFELKLGFRLQDAFQKFDHKGASYIYKEKAIDLFGFKFTVID